MLNDFVSVVERIAPFAFKPFDKLQRVRFLERLVDAGIDALLLRQAKGPWTQQRMATISPLRSVPDIGCSPRLPLIIAG